jgi:hypothetical protein
LRVGLGRFTGRVPRPMRNSRTGAVCAYRSVVRRVAPIHLSPWRSVALGFLRVEIEPDERYRRAREGKAVAYGSPPGRPGIIINRRRRAMKKRSTKFRARSRHGLKQIGSFRLHLGGILAQAPFVAASVPIQSASHLAKGPFFSCVRQSLQNGCGGCEVMFPLLNPLLRRTSASGLTLVFRDVRFPSLLTEIPYLGQIAEPGHCLFVSAACRSPHSSRSATNFGGSEGSASGHHAR